MGKTLKELIYNIRTIIKDNHSDDIKFTDRNIAFWIKYLRTKLIRQDFDKGRQVSDVITQELNLNLELVDSAKNKGVEVGNLTLKSTTKIPVPISSNTGKGDLITSVIGNANTDDVILVYQSKNKAIRNRHNKYGKQFPVAYLDQGYIYVIGCNYYIENLRLYGVFEDPEDVYKFNNPNSNIDYESYLDQEYPLEQHMIDMINSLIKSNELNLYFQLSEDKVNDSQNNSL